MKKDKKHKPWTGKDLGKRFVFYRYARREELSQPKMDATDFSFLSSGSVFILPIVKDKGMLIRVTETIVWKRETVYTCDCEDDCDHKPKHKKVKVRAHLYAFNVSGCVYEITCSTMRSGVNGWNVINPDQKKLK